MGIIKHYLVHGALTTQYVSIRILIVISKAKGLSVWVVDVKLAYLQSDKPLIRKIFITNPAPEFGISIQECFELLKPIYDYGDSEDQWHEVLDDNIKIDQE